MRETILEKKKAPFWTGPLNSQEIINGEEYMAPSPFSNHQRIVFKLAYIFRTFIKDKGLGEVFISPLNVILEEGVNRLQLDLIFYERYGVKEFYLVFPEERVIQVHINDNGRYRLFSYAEQKGSVRSQILVGLEINIEEIFGE